MQLVKDHINILLPLLVISAISRAIPGIEFLYYLTPILLILFIISGYEQILTNKQLMILIILLCSFGLWAALTSFWSDYPLISLSRAAYFLLVASGVSFGVVLWFKEHTSDKNLFGFLLLANILIVVSSLVSLVVGFPEDAWTAGNGMGFMGFFVHQNTFGMALLFTFPAPLYMLLKKISSSNFIKKGTIIDALLVLLLILLNILFIVLSHSRAALFSLFIGIFFVFILYFNLKQRLFFLGSLFLVALIVFTIPSLKSRFENYALKGTSHITANREILWEPSYESAKLGGLFGLGYGISHPEIVSKGVGSHFENGRYIREKGNSILGLVEEVGIIGLILFIIPVVYVFYLLGKQIYRFRKQHSVTSSPSLDRINKLPIVINASFLLAFIIHAQSEAWWVGTGSFSLLIFLMYIFLIPVSSIKPSIDE